MYHNTPNLLISFQRQASKSQEISGPYSIIRNSSVHSRVIVDARNFFQHERGSGTRRTGSKTVELWKVLHLQGRMSNYNEFHETCYSVTFYFIKKDSKRCCDTTTPESIHTKDESKRGIAFAFIFGVN